MYSRTQKFTFDQLICSKAKDCFRQDLGQLSYKSPQQTENELMGQVLADHYSGGRQSWHELSSEQKTAAKKCWASLDSKSKWNKIENLLEAADVSFLRARAQERAKPTTQKEY
jgi:hypothetical protein